MAHKMVAEGSWAHRGWSLGYVIPPLFDLNRFLFGRGIASRFILFFLKKGEPIGGLYAMLRAYIYVDLCISTCRPLNTSLR